MFSLFQNKENPHVAKEDFSYITSGNYYFDSSCQTLRPYAVLEAQEEYYAAFNACGGRVKYAWGEQVDMRVQKTRSSLLEMAGLRASMYATAFTLNTTYGINLVLSQLNPEGFHAIYTTDKEHNSAFLPTIAWAKKHHKTRVVLTREEDGSISLADLPTDPVILLMGAVSNIDGGICPNLAEVTAHVQQYGGVVLIDGAQVFAHHERMFSSIPVDAIFGSGHKMYGPSIGFILFKKDLLTRMSFDFIGGGTVSDVTEQEFVLTSDPQEPYALLEPGLQDWAGIIGLGASVEWKKKQKKELLQQYATQVYDSLISLEKVHVLGERGSTTLSIYVDGLDSHQLALYLGAQKIMCRSGYFCCHYYLKHKKALPPLLRISMGYHTTEAHVEFFIKTLTSILHSMI